MTVISEFVQNIIETDFATFDSKTIDSALDRIIDTMGCVISGAKAPGCAALIDLAREWGGKEEASIINTGLKVPTPTAAMINGVMARSYDFEPAGPVVDGKRTPSHLSGTTVPTAISVAESVGASGKDFLTALILGDDMASRVIAASELNLDSGFEPTGTVNAFGSAAIAAKLLKLNETQMLNTFGIVINQFSGTFQNIFDGAHTFKLPQGLAAQAGVFAARLAEKGFTGVKDPLFSKYGYFALYCKDYRLEYLTKNLGSSFYADSTFKPFPCCRSNHSAIECILEILEDKELPPDQIEEVIVSIPRKAKDFAVGQPFKLRDVPQIDAAFSIQYSVANALIRKSVKLEHYTDGAIKEQRVLDLIPRIHVVAGMPKEQPLSAEVKVVMQNGSEYVKKVEMPMGNEIFTPFTEKEKTDKYFESIKFAGISEEKGFEIFNTLKNIAEVDNVAGVVRSIETI